MKRQSWLVISLCLNVLLGGALIWAAKHRPDGVTGPRSSQMITQRVVRVETRTNETAASAVEVAASFHWSQVESTDYRTYIENLRALGCPELTICDIVSADVAELFDGKIKELVDGVTGRFWNLLVTPHAMERLIDEKQKELRTLSDQRDEMMTALFGEQTPADTLSQAENQADKSASDRRRLNFLPDDRFAKVMEIQDHFDRALREAGVSYWPVQHGDKFKELDAQRLREIQAELTPQEFQEYQLRTGDPAGVRNQLANFDGTEEEFRAIALAKLDSRNSDPLRQLLGPEKFAAYQRSQDNDYNQILRITERFDLPEATARQLHEFQKEASAQAKKIRENKSRTLEDRQTILNAIRAETEKSISAALATTEFKAYRKYHGAWLEQLTQIPQ